MNRELRQQNLRRLVAECDDGSQTRFAERIGRSPAYVGQLVRGVGSFGERIARQIEQACGKEPGWLDRPPGPAQRPVKSVSVPQMDAVPERDHPTRHPRQRGLCPVLSWVAAGSWHGMETPDGSGDDAEDWLSCPVRHGERTFVLRVKGESMYNPTGPISFSDGDLIFVDPDRQPENRSCVVVRRQDDQSATFKQLVVEGEPPVEHRYLKPLNPGWPEPIIALTPDSELCGVVIFKGTAL